MEINSSNISQIQLPQQQPQQQQVSERRPFEQDLASQEQAQQGVETTPAPEVVQVAMTDYTDIIRESRAQQTQSVQASTPPNESGQSQDVQHVAIAAYQNNQESYAAPTSSGELLPRVDAIV